MDAKTRARINHSTQNHLEIKNIVDNLLITKSNSVTLVIETNAVNFDLLSEEEQISKIMAFSGLLNSLSFPIQILITTKRIDITKYLEYLKTKENNTMSSELKRQLLIYEKFVNNLIIQNDVLDKNFYITISHYSAGEINNPINIAKAQKDTTQQNPKKIIEKAKSQLYFKRDHILKQLIKMGLTGSQLNTAQLIDIFYNSYNSE